MRLTFNLENKAVTFIGVFLIVVAFLGFSVAYNSGGPPSSLGHSFEEVEGVQKEITGICPFGKAMSGVNKDGTVNCVTLQTSNGAPNDEGYKLLASGSDVVLAAELRVTDKWGPTVERASMDNWQRFGGMGPVLQGDWPKKATEIIFEASNLDSSFCVGGEAELKYKSSGRESAKCYDYKIKGYNDKGVIGGNGRDATMVSEKYWARLVINDIPKEGCKIFSHSIPVGGEKNGAHGLKGTNVYCKYTLGNLDTPTTWKGDLTSLGIEEQSGTWNWKIWYR